MSKIARDPLYRRHRFPAEIIAHAVWLYYRFPLSLRMVEDMLAARGIIVTHRTIRTCAEKFGRHFANELRRQSAGRLGDKWHLDEVVVGIAGTEARAVAGRRCRMAIVLDAAGAEPSEAGGPRRGCRVSCLTSRAVLRA